MRYYIADQHFYHGNLNDQMDMRGFEDAEKMNEYMIARWNSRVRKNDEVIILGDFCIAGAKEASEILSRLNGRISLIKGNHDNFLGYRKYNIDRFEWVKDYAEMHDDGRKVILCHYPMLSYNGQYRLDKSGRPKTYMLYGHVHDTHDERLITEFERITRKTMIKGFDGEDKNIPCNMINCYCKYSDYTPLTLDEWIEITQKRRQNIKGD